MTARIRIVAAVLAALTAPLVSPVAAGATVTNDRAAVFSSAGTATAGTDTTQTTVEEGSPSGFTALPRPNSGQAPTSIYDRGGAAQFAVLGGILAAFALIALLFRRDIKRARRASGRDGGQNP